MEERNYNDPWDNGVYGTGPTQPPKTNSGAFALLLILVAVVSLTTGVVVAYLSTSTEEVSNSFVPETSETPAVEETFDQKVKQDVSVDVGDPGYAVFVRAAVIVTWQDEDGNVYGKAPEAGVDYTISYNDTNWFLKDGFWYCRESVASGNTPVLITTCSPIAGKAPDGYSLNVEIMTQTIQALGTTDADGTLAVTDAWGVTVSGGKLVP